MRIAEKQAVYIVPLRDPRVRELIDVPLSSLYEMARRSPPTLPGVVRVGRRVMIDLVVLQEWARSAARSRSEHGATLDLRASAEGDAS